MTEWPNLFLIGAPRAGTTTLHAALAAHPQIFMSPVKEPFFFVPLRRDEVGRRRIIDNEQEYLSLFSGAADKPVRGESSATYLWSEAAPARIRSVRPDARIVAILRDPVERAFSHYLLARREVVETRPFLQALEDDLHGREPPPGVSALRALFPGARSLYIDPSRYYDSLRRWRDAFGTALLVLFYEELFSDFPAALASVYEFVGVERSVASRIDLPRLNTYARHRGRLARSIFGSRALRRVVPSLYRDQRFRRLLLVQDAKPRPSSEARVLLESIFDPERQCLRDMLRRELPWP